MRRIFAAPILAAFALSACSSNDEDAAGDAMSGAEVADAMADAPLPEPGQYRTTQELVEFSVPGMTESMANMMRSAFADGAREPTTYCLTEAQAATSREDMIKNMAESNCTMTRLDMSGSAIDAAMTCPADGGISGDVTVTGNMENDGADMEMAFSTDLPNVGAATIRMRVKSERIGDCS